MDINITEYFRFEHIRGLNKDKPSADRIAVTVSAESILSNYIFQQTSNILMCSSFLEGIMQNIPGILFACQAIGIACRIAWTAAASIR